MIIILSPSKTLRNQSIPHPQPSEPLFPKKTEKLMHKLQRLSKSKLKKLMNISDNLTDLNYQRFKEFNPDFKSATGEPAIFTFQGDVFLGLEAETWDTKDLKYAESRLLILSGLYGLLRPGTLVQPYRLEMGTNLKTGRNKNLYEFWADDLTQQINKTMEEENIRILVNLASQEYSKAINFDIIKGEVVEINFRDWRNEKWTFVSFNAKKARGSMARYIIQNRIREKEDLKGFDIDNYVYNQELSSENTLFFTR